VSFTTCIRAAAPDVMAPDGSEVRLLAAASRGSMAQFTLPPGAVSKAVAHRTVEEVWLVLSGQGRMWRKLGDHEETVEFRNDGDELLDCVGVTMPPWPGMDEAVEVPGIW